LFLVSCNSNKDYIEINKDPIILEYDSTYKLDYQKHGKIENLKFDIENNNIVEYVDDVLYAKNPGETKLIITYNKDGLIEISIKVLERDNYIEINTEPIVLEYNSTYELEYKTYGKVDFIVFSMENDSIAVIDNNTIIAKNSGETKLIITYNKTEIIEIPIQVLPRKNQFDVGDPELNQKLFDEINTKLNDFSLLFSNSDYLTMEMVIKALEEDSKQTIKVINSPLYVEMNDGINESFIIQEENMFYEYLKIDENYYYIDYLGKTNEYEIPEDLINMDIAFDFKFDKNKINVKKEDNTYIFTSYIEDLCNDEYKELIEELYTQIGIPSNIIFDAVVVFKYKIENNTIFTSWSMSIDDWLEDESLPIDIEITIDLDEFEQKDLTNSNFAPGDCFEECKNITSFNDKFTIGYNETMYYKVEAKKGVITYLNASEVEMALYDMNYNLVSNSLKEVSPTLSEEYYSILPVEQDGTYYLLLTGRYNDNNVSMQNIEYETVFDLYGIDLSTINSFEGKIEGIKDLEKFVYYNTSGKIQSLKIKNNGEESIYLYDLSTKVTHEIYSKGIKSIKLNINKNEFFLYGYNLQNGKLYAKKYDINIDIEILDIQLFGYINEGEIPSEFITDSSDTLIYYTYLEEGMYSILGKYYNPHEIEIYNKNFEKVDNIFHYSTHINELSNFFTIHEANYYYVIIKKVYKNDNYIFRKYNYETLADINNPKSFDFSSFNEGVLEGNHDFEIYSLENNTDKIKVYTVFNNSNEEYELIYKEYKYGNYNNHFFNPGQRLAFAIYPNEKFDLMVSQFYKNNEEDNTINYSFTIEELENNNSSEIIEITEEYTEHNYLVGYSIPDLYFKIDVPYKCSIDFDFKPKYKEFFQPQFILMNENYQCISTTCEKGTYIVKVTNNAHVIAYGQIKYILTDARDMDVNVELKEVNNINNSGIYNEQVVHNQIVRYHFTLTKKTTVCYNYDDVVIYKENNEPAIIDIERRIYMYEAYVDLEPGNYYFITHMGSISIYGKEMVPIVIKEQYRDAPQDFNNMVVLNPNECMSFTKDYKYDCEFIKLVIENPKNYYCYVKGVTAYIYDENFNYVDYSGFGRYYVELEKGTYYLILQYNDFVDSIIYCYF
jgi:hypothetical protein